MLLTNNRVTVIYVSHATSRRAPDMLIRGYAPFNVLRTYKYVLKAYTKALAYRRCFFCVFSSANFNFTLEFMFDKPTVFDMTL